MVLQWFLVVVGSSIVLFGFKVVNITAYHLQGLCRGPCSQKPVHQFILALVNWVLVLYVGQVGVLMNHEH